MSNTSDSTTPSTLLAAAIEFHNAGLSVVPVRADGSKSPAVSWTRYQRERATPEQLHQWFRTDENRGIGVVSGAVSGGLLMIEFEAAALADGLWDQAADLMHGLGLEDEWAQLSTGWTERSPSGGVHLHVRVSGGDVPGNTKVARRPGRPGETDYNGKPLKVQTLIETRGEGGFAVRAPSAGRVHASGEPYVRVSGGPGSVPTMSADTVARIVKVLTAFDSMPEATARRSTATPRTGRRGGEGLSPGDDFNARADWSELLEGHFVYSETRGDVSYWTRSGKSHGISASTNVGGRDCLYVFSTSTEFPAETSLNKHAVHTLITQGSLSPDAFRASTKQLAAEGYGTPLEPRTDADGGGYELDDEDFTGEAAPAPRGDRLPEEFWNTTEQLQRVRQHAHAVFSSPDAVLHATLARIGALTSPTVRVDPGVKRPATIGWYAGLYGPSGAGKGETENAAEELVPFPDEASKDMANVFLSTGQGVIQSFLELVPDETDPTGKSKIMSQKMHRAYALATEGSVLDAMSQTTAGGTLTGVLCQAWMSEATGNSNASEDKRRELVKGTYAMSMSLGVQEEPAARLLAMGSIGLPQRLSWAHATLDRETTPDMDAEIAPVGALKVDIGDNPWAGDLASWVYSLHGTEISVSEQVTQDVKRMLTAGRFEDEASQVDPLDAHRPLWTLKAAALLALLHGELSVSDGMWSLANTLWDVSVQVRGHVAEAAERRREAEQAARRDEAVKTATASQAAVTELMSGVHPAMDRVARKVASRLTNHGEQQKRDLARTAVSKRDRDAYRLAHPDASLFTDALTFAVDQGWAVVLPDGKTFAPGITKP